MKVKFIIIGAGPAGLAFAATLKKNGEESFIILEKEKEAGGLCRSVVYDGAPLDIGGVHFLDVRRPHVNSLVFSYMPEREWNFYERKSKIVVGDYAINHPFEANIWQFPVEQQIDYLESIAKADHLYKEKPEHFTEWIYWKFGKKIAEEYMIPYNQKIWSCDLDMLGTYWMEKLPNVSFRDTIAGCLNHKAYGTIPAHAQFYYPKKAGFGEVFLRIADTLKSNIKYDYSVNNLDVKNRTVNNEYTGEYIINTAPWHEFVESLPKELQDLMEYLCFTSIDIDYRAEKYETDAQWIHFADTKLSYHRQTFRYNFIENAKGSFTETNIKRRENRIFDNGHFENKYAYPMNTIHKPEKISILLSSMKERNIYGLGRWGEWEYYNADVVMERGINLATTLLAK
jgi:protoporphyrinogen oxidase